MTQSNWFTADKKGLAAITMRAIDKRGPGILVAELFQNSMDANATKIAILIRWAADGRHVILECTDNGDGFARLSDAWTMFAPSIKKDDATKAGRFNVGEKFVLSIATVAKIRTMCGSVGFDQKGRTQSVHSRTDIGTDVFMSLKLKKENIQLMLDFCDTLIVPTGVELKVNGYRVANREPSRTFEETLPTEIGEELRRTERKTVVELHDVKNGETATLYELGIPVVETGDKYHVNVMQKVPLNVDRDNVTPSYLRLIRVHVLNNASDMIDEKDVAMTWVQEAASDSRSTPQATARILDVQYGADALGENPFDKEANAEAVAAGRTLIPSRALSRGFKDNLYKRGQVQTSSEVFSKKSFVNCESISIDEYTRFMKVIEQLSIWVAKQTCDGAVINVRFISSPDSTTVADFNRDGLMLRFNMSHPLFPTKDVDVVDLIIHELGHYYEGNHLSKGYYEALSKIGARLAMCMADRRGETFEELLFGDYRNA